MLENLSDINNALQIIWDVSSAQNVDDRNSAESVELSRM